MTSELGDERDPETGSFDADEWFRTQFGGQPAAEPPAAPPPVVPTPLTPPEPVGPPAQPAPPLYPPVTPPPSAYPPVTPPPPPAFPGTFAPPPSFADPTPTMPAVLPPSLPPTVEPAPTQLTPVVDPVATPFTPMIELEPTQPSEIVTSAPPLGDAATELMRQPEEGGALDELFGNDSFQEYDDTLISAVPRSTRRGAGAGGDGDADGTANTGEKEPLGRTQKILLWVAGSLVAVIALVAIFFVGTRIPLLLGPAPGAIPSPTATPSPSVTEAVRPIGPVAPGEYRWDEIWGGECIEPFVDAWQDAVTVVDCARPHGGQLVRRAPFPAPEGTLEESIDDLPYPGEEALAAQMSLLCSAPGVLNLATAGALTDLQVQGAFPVSEEQWDAGERDYFCFVSRSSGEPLTGSLAVPTPAA